MYIVPFNPQHKIGNRFYYSPKDASRVYKQTAPEGSNPDVAPPADEGDTIKMSNITSYANTAKQLIDANYAFTNRMSAFFDALCQVYKTLEVYPPESFSNRVVIREGYEKYLAAKAHWDSYIGVVNRQAAVCRSLARGWAGA